MAAKPKSKLANMLDDIPPPPAPVAARENVRPRRPPPLPEVTTMVGANLPPSYARNLAMLHAETGKSKKELLQRALDMLFTSMAGPRLKL